MMIRESQPAGQASRLPMMLGFPELFDFLLRRWKFIAATAALSTMVVVWLVLRATPIYTATSQLLLEVPGENVFGNERVLAQRNLGSEIVDSQILVLRSTALLEKMAEDLKLNNDPEFMPSKDGWPNAITGWLPEWLKAPEQTDEAAAVSDASMPATVALLRRAIDVSRAGASNVLEVSVRSSSAQKAAMLANILVETYVAEQIEARHERARRASIWLNERLALQQRQLEHSESAVEGFKVAHNLFATQDGSITEQQLSELNLALISARAEVAEKRSRYEQVERLLGQGGDLQAITDVQRSAAVTELRTRQAELTRTEADLLSKYGDRHPDLTRLRSELDEIARQIQIEMARVVAALGNELQVAESRVASLDSSLASVSGQSGIDNQLAVELRELERIATSDRTLYETFLTRARMADEEASMNVTEARIISSAHAPDSPTYPRKRISVLLGLIFGIGAGICGAAMREASRKGFIAESELEEAVERPVLASVPMIAAWKSGGAHIADDMSRPQFLRYNAVIESIGLGGEKMASSDWCAGPIHVTSALPGEGKTTLAISLALAAAAAGNRVLLIDGDLRQSAVTKVFGFGSEAGLVDVLGMRSNPLDAIHLHGQTGMHILPAGTTSRSQRATLLGSAQMRLLLEQLRSLFNVIIIDSPPAAVAIDAEIIAGLAEKVIFVVRWNHTRRETIIRMLNRLKAQHRPLDVVLTMVDEQKLPRYGRHASFERSTIENYYLS